MQLMAPRLTFEERVDGQAVILAVAGDVDLATVMSLEERAAAALERAAQEFVLELSGVEFCDSTGIAGLLRVRNATVAAGRDFRIEGVGSGVRRVLATVGLIEALNVAE
jgi:anti-sigma B factor antagonist